MQDSVFEPAGQGDPIYMQHLIWVLGQPETWITLFLYGCLLVGIVKMTRQLWRKKGRLWGLGFLSMVGLVLGYYTWLSVNALEFYRQGRGSELVQLNIGKLIILGLSLSALVWIIISSIRKRRKIGS